ncbi:MAG: phosphoribosylformylglycinamidine synthase subunit PurL [Fimbriiglobus sp.]
MLWEVEIRPIGRDGERERVCDEFDLLTHSDRGGDLIQSASRGFLLQGELDEAQVQELTTLLLVDPLVETHHLRPLEANLPETAITVLYKPGVMDPVSESVTKAALDLGIPVEAVRTFRRYYGPKPLSSTDRDIYFRRILANGAIEQVLTGTIPSASLGVGAHYEFRLTTLPIRDLDDAGLMALSQAGQLALTLDEMKTIQAHFREHHRDPSDVELESIAQTWSEHCSHKTLKGTIDYTETLDGKSITRRYGNLLKETIFGATQTLRQEMGDKDWCVSVFVDNAGVIHFDDKFHLAFKVETHNRPSAIEPYGGANTGLGGVIRDVLGTALGGKPICNTDVFCFARPDFSPDDLPQGVLHPRRVMQGVVNGVRDYGNRMGIPTVNGAIYFDDRYLANPLVFCGTVGLIPVGMEHKEVQDGDLIVAIGGRTGRDGIHGATFSSVELTDKSEVVSGGAVQIGNAIEEKKVLDVLLQARDRRLYTAITDCGAGGFSSAVGEMGAELGAHVHLDKAPLKYDGLSYTEIWISESQERMVVSVNPAKWQELHDLCRSEGVESVVLGTFEKTGRLKLSYHSHEVANLDMHFLHEGRPKVLRQAHYTQPTKTPATTTKVPAQEALLKVLRSYTVASKESVIRQYDHEVQGGSVIKPLVGVMNDGPSDAAVIMPVLGSWKGAAIGNGLNPRYADLDPWASAACAIDEAVRNVVAVGADPSRIAILDNFCWGNVTDPQLLGALVRTAEACRDVALAYKTPFISGKDSLNNEYKSPTKRITIPSTLLISSLGIVHDVRQCVTMDFKAAGHRVIVIGITKEALGGSTYHDALGLTGGDVPCPDINLAPKIFTALHAAIRDGLVRSCHDVSDGGLAAALAEMAFAGGIGADITGLGQLPTEGQVSETARLFGESPTRFVLEVVPEKLSELQKHFAGLSICDIGVTLAEPRLRIAGNSGEWLIWAKLAELKEAWQSPLRNDSL